MNYTGFYSEKNKTLDLLRKHFFEKGIPVIKDDGLSALCHFVKIKNPSRVLEIGTAAGLSGCAILMNTDGKLVTVEKDARLCQTAKENFEKFSLSERAEVICGDAAEVIKNLSDSGEKFEFIFLDGPKAQYKNYLSTLIKLMDKGSVLFADNVLFRSFVENDGEIEKNYRSLVRSIRAFLDMLKLEKTLDTAVYNIGDGISVSVKL